MIEIRILQVFAYTNLSRIEFANRLKISNAVLSHISSGRNKAGMDLVIGVLTEFPEIDSDWLLFGKGEMLKQNSASKIQQWKLELNETVQQMKENHQMMIEKLNQLEYKITNLE